MVVYYLVDIKSVIYKTAGSDLSATYVRDAKLFIFPQSNQNCLPELKAAFRASENISVCLMKKAGNTTAHQHMFDI